jgi:hypothetical protein
MCGKGKRKEEKHGELNLWTALKPHFMVMSIKHGLLYDKLYARTENKKQKPLQALPQPGYQSS